MKNIGKLVAVALMGLGVMVMVIGAVNWQRAAEGLKSLDAVYEAQNVLLPYDEDGQLVDRGQTSEAQAILSLLETDWAFPVDHADLDPADPLVNTPTELMYQYATISYHVLHGTQTIVLDETVEYDGETFAAGPHEFAIDGRYWTDFDRQHPLEGPARDMAWSGAHGLLASISSGVAADYQAGFAHFAAWRTLIIGFAFALGGFGLLTLALRQDQTLTTETTTKAKAKAKDLARAKDLANA